MSHIIKKAFGDFQTPVTLAENINSVLSDLGANPKIVFEPNCGIGSILLNTVNCFENIEIAYGLEINKSHIEELKNNYIYKKNENKIKLFHADYFSEKISEKIKIPESIPENDFLIIGNPPWVTNSELGALGKNNLPEKSNFNSEKGIAAITGKSNFDISEYIFCDIIENFKNVNFTFAMLCKTAVARKILLRFWKKIIISMTVKYF